MKSLESQYNQVLVKLFGTQVEKDLEVLKVKFSAVVAAHLFAGNVGNNSLCQLNQVFTELLKNKEVKK